MFYNNQIFFDAEGVDSNNPTTGYAWRFDPETGDGVSVAFSDIGSGSAIEGVSGFQNPIVYQDKLYFYANAGTNNYELWRYDSTTQKATRVPNVTGAGIVYDTEPMIAYNDKLFFIYDNGSDGKELWSFDAQSEQAFMIADVNPQSGTGSEPKYLTVFNDQLYFNATHDSFGQELWRYDDNTKVTSLVADIVNGEESGNPRSLVVLGDSLYFHSTDRQYIWRLDKDAFNVAVEQQFDSDFAATIGLGTLYGYENQLCFTTAEYQSQRRGVRCYDPATKTHEVLFSAPFDNYGAPSIKFVAEDKIYYATYRVDPDIPYPEELFVYDTSEKESTRISSNAPYSSNGQNYVYSSDKAKVYFSGRSESQGHELMQYDTTSGTVEIAGDIRRGNQSSSPEAFIAYQGSVVFQPDFNDANKLYQFDHQSKTVSDVIEEQTIPFDKMDNLVVYQDKLYFTLLENHSVYERELWRYDSADDSLTKIADFRSDGNDVEVSSLTVFDDKLYFIVTDSRDQRELRYFDGNTNSLETFGIYKPRALHVHNDVLYFISEEDSSMQLLAQAKGEDSATLSGSVGYHNESNIDLFLLNDDLYLHNNGGLYYLNNDQLDLVVNTTTYSNNTFAVVKETLFIRSSSNTLAVYDPVTRQSGDIWVDGQPVTINQPAHLVAFGDELYFSYRPDEDGDAGLWRYNVEQQTLSQVTLPLSLEEGHEYPKCSFADQNKLFCAAEFTDQHGAIGEELFVVSSDGLFIEGTPAYTAETKSLYQFTPQVFGGDADNYTFEVDNKPDWLNFDATTGTLSGTPRSENVGIFDNLKIRVSDGNTSTAIASFKVNVVHTNAAPVISIEPETQVSQGQTYSFTPKASDADGDPLSFIIQNQPAWLDFDQTTGVLSGVPGNEHVGEYEHIKIGVSDGFVTTWLPAFTLTVLNVNDSPSISGVAVTEILENQNYNFAVSALDIDGDVLSFSIENKPAWLDFDQTTGVLSGTPMRSDYGTYEGVVISVSDGELSASLSAFSITVTINNSAPSITDEQVDSDATSQLTIDVLANDSDPEGDSFGIVSAQAEQGTVTISNNRLVYTPKVDFEGTDIITYEVEDEFGASAQGQVTVTVQKPVVPDTGSSVQSQNSTSGGGSLYLMTLLLLLISSVRMRLSTRKT